MHLVRKIRRTTMLVGAGAVAAYYLDPDSGVARRQRVIDQVRSLNAGDQSIGDRLDEMDRTRRDLAGTGRADDRDGQSLPSPSASATAAPVTAALR